MIQAAAFERPRVTYAHPWHLVVAVNFGQTAALASSIGLINLLMPRIMTEVSADVQSIQWVQTAFLLTMVILLPAVGWLGSVLGQRRLYMFSLSLFCVTTLLCTLAWNLPSLILLRILQAVGAGLFFPLGTPFIFDAFPLHRRGFVMGVSTLMQSLTSLGGSVLASHLADLFGWRWGFYYLTTLALIGLVFSASVLRERPIPRAGRFDLPGCLSLAVALISLLLLITGESRTAFLTSENIGLLAVFAASTVAFFLVETKTAEPFVDLRLYRYPAYATGSFIGFLVPAASMSTSFLLPIYLQGLQGYSVFQTSLIYLPSGLIGTLLTPLAGGLSDRMDARILIASGLIGMISAIGALSTITDQTSLVTLALTLTLLSASTAFIFTPMSNTMFNSLPHEDVRLGAGLYALKRQLGRSLGSAAISAIFATRLNVHGTMLFDAWSQPQSAARTASDFAASMFRNFGAAHPDASAFAMIQDTLWDDATLAAFSDCFLTVCAALALTLIPLFFLRGTRNGASD